MNQINAESHKEFSERVLASHEGQRQGLAKLALDEITSGLAKLHSLGHNVKIVEGLEDAIQEWPQWFWHPIHGNRIFVGPDEVEEGWLSSKEKAEAEASARASGPFSEEAKAASSPEPSSEEIGQPAPGVENG